MNQWNMFISRFTPAERPVVSALIDFMRQSLNVDDLSAIAEMQPPDLANVLAAVVGGDNPFTDQDDRNRLVLAARAIAFAREVLAAADVPAVPPPVQVPRPEPPAIPSQTKAFAIVGHVLLPNGKPYAGGNVRAVDKDLRAEEPIGESTIDDTGYYEIQYQPAPPRREARPGADIVVRVFDPAKKSAKPLAESPVRFHAGPRETIDLVAGEAPRTAFDQLLRLLAPALDGTDPATLTQADIDFLAGDSGVAADRIAGLVIAVKMAAHTSLPAQAFFDYLETRRRNSAALDQFWQSVPTVFGLKDATADTFRFVAQMGDIVRFDLPLVASFVNRRATKGITSAIELALWSWQEWLTLVDNVWDGRRASVPAWATGEDRDAQLRDAAASLLARAAEVFPTTLVSRSSISGRIVTPSGQPAAGVRVQAAHCRFQDNMPIASAVEAGVDGRYRVAIDQDALARQLATIGKVPLRLRVSVRSSDDTRDIGQSEIRNVVSLPVTVDLQVTVEVGPTEFDIVSERIVAAAGAQLTTIDLEKDAPALAGAAGIDLEVTRLFLAANQAPDKDSLSVEARYALLRTASLQKAVDARIAGEGVLDYAKAAGEWLKQRAVDERVEKLRGPFGPGEMLKAAGLDESEADAYLRVLAADPQATPETIERRLKETEISEIAFTRLRRARRLAQIIGPDATLVGWLLAEVPAPRAAAKTKKSTPAKTEAQQDDEAIGVLAERSVADWQAWIEEHDRQLSPADAASRARTIEKAFERAYPQKALLGRLGMLKAPATNGGPNLSAIKAFLEKESHVNLRDRGLSLQLSKEKKSAAEKDPTAKTLKRNVEKLQRLSRIASFGHAADLLVKGHSSAQSIAAMSRQGFIRQVAGGEPPEGSSGDVKNDAKRRRDEAAAIHQRAQRQATAALALATGLSLHYTGITPRTVPGHGGGVKPPTPGGGDTPATGGGVTPAPPAAPAPTPPPQKADLTMFGAPDACQVAPCQSVLGMAAYFVDLLELVHHNGADIDPRSVLLYEDRRPDLAEIELSCPNSETPVPYIDLVIELLEHKVSPQTRRATASGPTDRGMRPWVSADSLHASDRVTPIAAALGGNTIAGLNTGTPVPFPQTTWAAEELAALPEHLNEGAYTKLEATLYPWTLPFSLAREEAEIYLADLQLSREELMKRFRQRPPAGWANPVLLEMASARLGISATERSCLIAGVGVDDWTLWGYKEDPGDWPGGVGTSVADFLQRTGLHYADLAELLNTDFINKKVDNTRPVTPKPDPNHDACDLSHTTLEGIDEAFLNRFSRFVRLWRRLGWTVGEVDRAIAVLKAADITGPLLIQLAEITRLAARLTLPIADILTFWGKLDTQPAFDRTGASPMPKPSQYDRLFQNRARLSAKDRGKLARSSAETITLASVSGPVCAALGVSAENYALLTDEAERQKWRLGAATIPAADKLLPGASALQRWQTLARVTSLSIRDLLRFQTASGLDPFADGPVATARFLDALDTLARCGLTVDDADFVLRHVSAPERARKFEDQALKLLKRVRDEAIPASSEEVPITGALIRPMLIREIARASQVASPIIDRTITWLEAAAAGAGLDSIATAVSPGTELDSTANLTASAAWAPYARLAKWVWLVRRLGLSPEDFASTGAVQHPLKLFALETAAVTAADATPAGLFANWEQLAILVDLGRRLSEKGLSFWPVRAASASWASVAQQIDSHVGDIGTLVGPTLLGLGAALPGDSSPEVWIRFFDAIDLAGRLEVPVAQLTSWVKETLTLPISAEIRAAVAATHDAGEWKLRAPRLRNRLREKQRDALIAAAIHRLDAQSADDLHGRYLVDVEMGSEQFTTRLGLAVASVQRFIQRALLGVERDRFKKPVAFESDFDLRWVWMKSYRSWRDNRKLFLYPENYLRPELRDDKSPLFIELEQLLSQRDLTADAIEDGFGAYLHQLDEIARPEIMGTCFEDVDGDRLLHIVGRTRGVPHDYFHRTWNPTTARFSPWRRLDLDIDGDWVMPIVLDGRLNLYWIKHTRQIEGMKETLGLNPARPFPMSAHYPMYQDQYTLSWSTRRRKSWSAKRAANRQIARPFLPFFDTQFAVRLNADQTRLKIGGITAVPVPPMGNVERQDFGGWVNETFVEPVKRVFTPPSGGPQRPGGGNGSSGIIPTPDFQGIINQLVAIGGTIDAIKQLITGGGDWSIKGALEALWENVPDFDDASVVMPESIRNLFVQIRNAMTELGRLLSAIGPFDATLPQRATAKVLETFGQAFTGIINELLMILKKFPDEILKGGSLFVDGMLGQLQQVLSEIRLGLGGPTFGFEFGYFDVGAAGAQGLRLSPPPFLMSPLTGPAMVFNAATASLAILGEAIAMLLYSLFPGYPAFHDVPILTGVLYTNLALGGDGPDDLGIKAWPGTGYFLLPSGGTLHAASCSVAVNLEQIKTEELDAVDTQKLKTTIFSGAPKGPMEALDKIITLSGEAVAIADATADRLSDLSSLFNIGMRVVQPAPLGAFPGRLMHPPPTIIGEDRHGRTFLLNPIPQQAKDHRFPAAYVAWDALPLYHPLTTIMSRTFEQTGVPGVYDSATRPNNEIFSYSDDRAFKKSFIVSDENRVNVHPEFAVERLELSPGGAYSLYNWELFYHIPMLIGARFAVQQDFEQALRWYRYIFDPTVSTGESPQRHWRFKAFYEEYSGGIPDLTINSWLRNLSSTPEDSDEQERLKEQQALIAAWQRDPFNAHLIARLRPGAYERAVVMRTIEAFINWGDARFREGTWESINEATQLYLLARDILGPRPELVPARPAQPLTYKALDRDAREDGDGIDPFGNALLTIESSIAGAWDGAENTAAPSPGLAVLSGSSMLYFPIPPNEQLLGYWDTVDDRLFKIRQSLDIRGKKRSTFPLGSDLADALSSNLASQDTAAGNAAPPFLSLPAYRFQTMAQKANEFAGDVKTLGAALLSALEKRDAEALALLRSGHEIQMLQAAEQIRQLQIDESSRSLEALKQSKAGASLRYDYYTNREFLNAAEAVKEALFIVSSGLQLAVGVQEMAAAVLHALPEISVGAGGFANLPNANLTYGSTQLGNAVSSVAKGFSAMASMAQTGSAMAGTIATYERRQEEWDHQAELAQNDVAQFDLQIAAAEKRLAVTQRELVNHRKQIVNAREVATFMHEKFSNEELFDWMAGQVSAAHFQSYLLALDLARQAEAGYRFERADRKASFIRVEQPDSLTSAMLCGERLQQDLRRMEAAYLAKNTREHELTKHVSLAQLDPVALLMLQQKGECYFSLPEFVFDADHPGHYFRRLKTVSLSIPCVVGPYTGVNCRLTLVNSEFRVDGDLPQGQAYARSRGAAPGDARFVDVPDNTFIKLPAGTTAIVTSTAQNDSGVFELNLKDERYLPFEGAGAISSWRIELPKDTNRFDFSSIADVIVHLRYTARDGTPELREEAWEATFGVDAPTGIAVPVGIPLAALRQPARMFSVRHEFPDAWHRFLHPPDNQPDAVLDLDLSASRFPYTREGVVDIKALRLVVVSVPGSSADGLHARLEYVPGGAAAVPIAATPTAAAKFAAAGDVADLASCTYQPGPNSAVGRWRLRITAADNRNTPTPRASILNEPVAGTIRVPPDRAADLLVLCVYDVG